MIDLTVLDRVKTQKDFLNLISSEYGDNADRFDSLFGELDKYVNQTLRQDLNLADKIAASIFKFLKFTPKDQKSRIYAIRGRVAHWRGKYETALKHYLKAENLNKANRNYLANARLGKGSMDVYMYLGRYADAIKRGKASLNYFRKKDMRNDAGQVLNNIGNVYHRSDNNKLALRYYKLALDIFEDGGGIPLAIIQFNMANIYSNLNRLEEAEKLYLAAAQIYKTAGLKIAENQARYSLAYLYFLKDDFSGALKLFESVEEKFSDLGDKRSVAVTQMDRVELDLNLNQFGSSLMLSNELLPAFENLGMRYELAKTHYFSFEANLKLGNLKAANTHLVKSERLFSKEKNKLWLGLTTIGAAKLKIAAGKHEGAIKLAEKASRLYFSSGDKRRSIDADLIKAEALIALGRLSRAGSLINKIDSEKLTSFQAYQSACLSGDLSYSTKNYIVALRSFRKAVNRVEKMIGGLYPDEVKLFFAIDKYYAYKMVVTCLLKLGRVKDSFVANLKGLAFLSNQSYSIDNKLVKEVSPDLIARREELRAQLNKFNNIAHDGIRTASDTFHSVEQKIWHNERKIRTALYNKNVENSGSISDIFVPVLKDKIIISYLVTEKEVGIFLNAGNKVDYVSLDVSLAELKSLIRKIQFLTESTVMSTGSGIKSTQALNGYLARLYTILIKPIESKLTGPELIILAEEFMAQIPFHALLDTEGQYLVNKYDILRAINPEDLTSPKKSSGFIKKKNAVFAAGSSYLPMVNVEAKRIGKLYKLNKIYNNEAANRENLIGEIGKVDGFLHIAAHASRSSENPLFSRILLNDGPFFPFDLFSSGLKAELVTLSGCQTAAPGLYYGNSYSLAKAFYQAGSRFVLATLWPVADDISLLFMNSFYGRLKEYEVSISGYKKRNINDLKRGVSIAYKKAINDLLTMTDEPAYWGAFILYGL